MMWNDETTNYINYRTVSALNRAELEKISDLNQAADSPIKRSDVLYNEIKEMVASCSKEEGERVCTALADYFTDFLEKVIGNGKKPISSPKPVGEQSVNIFGHVYKTEKNGTVLNLGKMYDGIDYNDGTLHSFKEIEGLEKLRWLETLSIRSNKLKDLEGLACLPRLRKLHLNKCYITDISALSKLTRLEELNLRMNRVTDIRPLAGLKKLRILDLSVNRLKDISALKEFKEMKQLEKLDLSYNQIHDGSPLEMLKDVKEIIIQENPIGKR